MQNDEDECVHEVLRALKDNSTLTHFSMAKTYLSKEGRGIIAEFLKDNETLETLNMQSNSITDEIIDALQSNKTLREIKVGYFHKWQISAP